VRRAGLWMTRVPVDKAPPTRPGHPNRHPRAGAGARS
jgi:hypothetical protein